MFQHLDSSPHLGDRGGLEPAVMLGEWEVLAGALSGKCPGSGTCFFGFFGGPGGYVVMAAKNPVLKGPSV